MEWIKISEKHPNTWKDREVIVYMPFAYTTIDVQTVYNDGNGGSCFGKGWNKGESEFQVTHWMPLPAAPETE